MMDKMFLLCDTCINLKNSKCGCKETPITFVNLNGDMQGCSHYKEKKKEHICKFCIHFTPIDGFSKDHGICKALIGVANCSKQDKDGRTYECSAFKRKTIDKKPKYNCIDHCKFYGPCFKDEGVCKDFERKKIDKVKKKKKSPKEKLKERFKKKTKYSDLGYSLHYEFKSGKYEGMNIKEVIDHDYTYIEFLINKDFRINSEAVQYLHKVKEKKNKEQKEATADWIKEQRERQKKQQEEKRKWEENFNRKTQEDRRNENSRNNYGSDRNSWEDFFRRHFHGSSSFSQPSSKTLDKQHGGVLGLSGKVQKLDIKKFYYKAALKWHPDKHNNSIMSIEKMKGINNAWDYFKKKYQLS